MKRAKIWEKIGDKIIRAEISSKMDVVFYFNGEKGEDKKIWTSNFVPVKNGKAKDVIVVPARVSHNKGNKTVTENKKLEIPVEYSIDVKSIGTLEYTRRRVYGEFEEQRIHHFVNGKDLIDPEKWEELTEEQKKHLEKIDVWDAYDELREWLESENRKPSAYIGALQQIYNRTKRKTRQIPKYIKIPTHRLVGVDITIKAKTPGWEKVYHFNTANYEECKNIIVRSVHFELPRVDILKKYLKEVEI